MKEDREKELFGWEEDFLEPPSVPEVDQKAEVLEEEFDRTYGGRRSWKRS